MAFGQDFAPTGRGATDLTVAAPKIEVGADRSAEIKELFRDALRYC